MFRAEKPITNPELKQALEHLEASLEARRILEKATRPPAADLKRDSVVRHGAANNDLLQHKKLGKDF